MIKTTQTTGSAFAERIVLVKKLIFELELRKHGDCCLDGYGKFDSSLRSFRTKSL